MRASWPTSTAKREPKEADLPRGLSHLAPSRLSGSVRDSANPPANRPAKVSCCDHAKSSGRCQPAEGPRPSSVLRMAPPGFWLACNTCPRRSKADSVVSSMRGRMVLLYALDNCFRAALGRPRMSERSGKGYLLRRGAVRAVRPRPSPWNGWNEAPNTSCIGMPSRVSKKPCRNCISDGCRLDRD